MEIRFGLISCDSHAQLDRDAFTSRMPRTNWGDRIPQVVEIEHQGKLVERWSVDGKPWLREVVNCPAAMPDKSQRYPDRWEDVPRTTSWSSSTSSFARTASTARGTISYRRSCSGDSAT